MTHKRTRFLPLLATAMIALSVPVQAAQTYQKDYVGKMEMYRANYQDTLVHLARKYGLGFVEMRAANPTLDPWIPGDGARVVLPTQSILPDAPRKGIVINLAEMKLYLFQNPGEAPIVYSISPGREGLNTPLGQTTVTHKKVGPSWTPTPRMLKEDPTLKKFYPPGPDNPLGTHALYLGFPEIRIHGTNKPYAIGRRASSGCIRMYPEAIKDIYNRVPDGTIVTVVDQPVKVGWIDDKMFVEVSPTQEQSLKIEQIGELKSYEITTEDMRRITGKAGALADNIDWEAVRKAVREHRGYPVPVLDRKGTKGAHVVDEMEAEIQKADAEDKIIADKQKAEMKAAASAREAAKPDVYGAKKAAKEKEVKVVNTQTTPRTVNQ
ncbi:MAG: hypothetical protein DI551_06165 [Micavibrio aeruginosavorus]|uniref:L,D-TPase catalytic domain-containing protein n=1 Tax=Micavibrio aeruginosavorus TaxID=349221 RepID=A0A2W5N579_9BACT|nr:MAG: hypothetical protein DI551_06165 [Micavibrio aeruginosavorus]